MKLMPLLVFIGLFLVACSGSKSSQTVSEETPQIELSEADEFIDEGNQGATTEAEPVLEEPVQEVTTNGPLVQESNLENPSPTPAPVVGSDSGTVKQYTVQKNETLMMISFKLYGDYARWRDLANQNSEQLKGGTLVREGMVLNYNSPTEEFVWNPQGNPYLIKTGDTLGLISRQVYTTPKKWKLLWENNKPLIKDPNKIFAGFTIYYTESDREVAAEL